MSAEASAESSRGGPRGLVFRLYAVGLVQLLLVAVAAVVIGAVVSRMPNRLDVPHLTERLVGVKRADLAGELRALRDAYGVRLSVYEQDEKLVATNVEPPLLFPRWGAPHGPPPDGPPPGGHPPPNDMGPPPNDIGPPPPPNGPPPGMQGTPPHDHDHGGGPPHFGHPPDGEPPRPPVVAEVQVDGVSCVMVARFERPKPSDLPPLLTFVAGLFVVGAGAVLTARWIARPVEQLARAARALGEGDMRARANLPGTDVLADVGKTFDEMAERIAALLVAEKELLANVSHELRTPLSRIRVALDLAAEGDGEAARAAMAEIGVDLEELEALLNDVLHAARLGLQADGDAAASRGFALHLGDQDPSQIAEAAAERFRSHHPRRPFEVDQGEALPVIRADQVLLRRVLDNLLENADKYTPDGNATIRLRCSRTDGGVSFEVTDAGVGIAPEDLPHVFTPFFRAERSRSRGTGGVGLGLTLAKRITEAHGGTIVMTSEVGRGTTARVTVPAARGDDPKALT